jgi:hypothetical protein
MVLYVQADSNQANDSTVRVAFFAQTFDLSQARKTDPLIPPV